jgi:hypothetical protein
MMQSADLGNLGHPAKRGKLDHRVHLCWARGAFDNFQSIGNSLSGCGASGFIEDDDVM